MQLLNFGAVRVYLGEKSGKYPDGNQVIVQGAEERVAFDTPLSSLRVGADLEGVDAVILSHVHEDHTVSLGRLPQARVQVHAADLAAVQSLAGLRRHYGYAPEVLDRLMPMVQGEFHFTPRPDATAYADGQTWNLGGGVRIRAHHLPGHTSGHCALVVESEGVAFIGDIDLTGFGPYYGDATSSLRDFQQSLKRITEIDAKVWVTSHHRGVLTSRADFLQALARFAGRIEERSAKLLGYLRERPHTLDQLVARRVLYPQGYDVVFVESAERRTMEQHLAQLLEEGAVARDEGGRWRLA